MQISSAVRARLQKVAEAGRVRAGLQEVEAQMNVLRQVDYSQVQPGRLQGTYAEKLAYYSEITDGNGNADRWVDRFKGTPFHDAAKALAAEDARYAVLDDKRELQRDLERIQSSIFRLKRKGLEARLAEYRLDHPAPQSKKSEDTSLPKTAAPAWLAAAGQRVGKALVGTPARRAMTGTAAGAFAAGAGFAAGRRSAQGKSVIPVSIPAKILNSRVFQTLLARVRARFPDVPEDKIKQLIYEAMKEKGVLEKVSAEEKRRGAPVLQLGALGGVAGATAGAARNVSWPKTLTTVLELVERAERDPRAGDVINKGIEALLPANPTNMDELRAIRRFSNAVVRARRAAGHGAAGAAAGVGLGLGANMLSRAGEKTAEHGTLLQAPPDILGW